MLNSKNSIDIFKRSLVVTVKSIGKIKDAEIDFVVENPSINGKQINQGQLDRWNIVSSLNYLDNSEEEKIIFSKIKELNNKEGKEIIQSMVATAELTRSGFINGDISTVMSPRTVIIWAENYLLFKDIEYSFKLSFLKRCDELERSIIHEYYQRAFGIDISDAKVVNVKQ